MSRIDDILTAGAPQNDNAPEAGFVKISRTPQMGFEIDRNAGALDAIFYHSIDNLDIRMMNGHEHLVFTHRRKIIVIQGQNLKPLLRQIIAHKIEAIRDYAPPAPLNSDQPRIDHIQITNLEDRDTDAAVA